MVYHSFYEAAETDHAGFIAEYERIGRPPGFSAQMPNGLCQFCGMEKPHAARPVFNATTGYLRGFLCESEIRFPDLMGGKWISPTTYFIGLSDSHPH